MPVPSGVLAGAAVSASALASIIDDLAGRLVIPAGTAVSVSGQMRRIVRVRAPRATTLAAIGSIGATLVATVQAMARDARPADASAGLYVAAASSVSATPRSASPVLTAQYGLARALAASVEVACLGEAFLAEARTAFADRRSAGEARDRIGASFDAAADRIARALGQEVLAVLGTVARQTSAFLVSEATTLKPIVRVQAMRSFPSTALAWNLYADPGRAEELLHRNRCGTPLFMPTAFEALSPND